MHTGTGTHTGTHTHQTLHTGTGKPHHTHTLTSPTHTCKGTGTVTTDKVHTSYAYFKLKLATKPDATIINSFCYPTRRYREQLQCNTIAQQLQDLKD